MLNPRDCQSDVVQCQWRSGITTALLDQLYGLDKQQLENNYFLVELLLCSTYYQEPENQDFMTLR